MPIGGDLGFSYLVLVVPLLASVIALVVRRNWQLSVARSEEIQMLLVLASEEAARVELEASVYVAPVPFISRPLQYQCAVCFSPTTTRCARCKAVRYCSGKCQIVHWRQGHKDECHPFTIPHQLKDVGCGSNQKVLEQGVDMQGISSETGGTRCAESVPNSELNCSPVDFCGNRHNEVECLADGISIGSSSDETERAGGHPSSNFFPEKVMVNGVSNVDQNGPPSLEHTTSVIHVDHLTHSGNRNKIKPHRTNHDDQYRSTSSSGCNADGTKECSFSNLYTPSGFWDGTINRSSSRIDSHDDCSSNKSGYMQNSLSSLSSPFNFDSRSVPSVEVKGSDDVTVVLDTAHSTTLGIKKSVNMNIDFEEVREDALKQRSSLLPSSENPDGMGICNTTDLPGSKSGEPKYTSPGTYSHPSSSVGGSPISTHASKVSRIKSLSPQKVNQVTNGSRSTLHPLISENDELSTRVSVAHLPSTTRKHSFQCAKAGKDDSIHTPVASSEFASYLLNSRNRLKTSMRKVVNQLRVLKSSQHYLLGVESEVIGKYIDKALFPYELFVKLYNWKKIELFQPCGLINRGNSCYANAVLQCLACTPPLTAYLLQGLHSKACKWKEWCFTCEFQSLMLKAKEGNSLLSPVAILSQIHKIKSHFGDGNEEDAHEFLRYAIDAMQSVCLKEAGVNASGSLEEETTLVGLTFGGYLRSKIKCMKCGGKSEQHERMMDLTVEIGGDIATLEGALQRFTGTEILDGENKYQCSRCRSYERAKKKFRVLEAPNVLTIALKRFQSGKFGKLNKSIQFPEILDLAPFMSGTSDKSPIYRLYGVVVHLDIMNATFSGHYVCYVKNSENKWFEIDDSTVKAVDLESVLTKRAYMLLYARCSPRAPRVIRYLMISDPRKPKNPKFKSISHSTSPSNSPSADPFIGHTGIECPYPKHTSFHPVRMVLEEDSPSEYDSSIFSEECSNSTESSNRDYSSTDDYFDSIFGNFGIDWNSYGRNNSSDSDSSSSSGASPSSLYSTGKSNIPFLDSDSTKHCRNLGGSSSSCRVTDWNRLRWNPFVNKRYSLLFRRSMRERIVRSFH